MPKFKWSWTKGVVALFLVILLCALVAERADARPVVSLGHTALNSHNTVGEIGWQFGTAYQWEVAATAIGRGHTDRGPIDRNWAYSVSRRVQPGWSLLGAENYYRLGVAYVDGSPLVGDINYRLGVGLHWGVVALEYLHYSSAGINDPNTGIDGIQIRVFF
ncbi:acyloxyacyl hydrolase [Microbulbifer sp. ALW1]|uniref:acyloxyacyl hydrolase n=1 Tax=Microbulbifer sp. (strain ALW1) TaxID=1516059 RepID=UPI00135A6AD9|nr:acyloxyacyl hydrolase [Microbulbifer sp. ALW1]